jgi:hypothetical protein
MITGYPIESASRFADSASVSGSTLPGSSGSPASVMAARAEVLSPSFAITDAGGPMNVMPFDSQTSAKSASSERNP